MTPLRRWSAATVLLSTPLAFAPPARAEDPPPPSPRPISGSVDRVVDKLEEERKGPCRKAIEEGVPCFPVSTEIQGPKVSVRDSLGDLGPAKATSPDRPPTRDDMDAFRPGPIGTVMNFATLDPGCVGKSVLKSLQGKNDVYYLYRVRDVHGERVVLHDRRLNAITYQGDLEFLGRFEGECEALAAYRRQERRLPPIGPR
jgi:hypothetical protein